MRTTAQLWQDQEQAVLDVLEAQEEGLTVDKVASLACVSPISCFAVLRSLERSGLVTSDFDGEGRRLWRMQREWGLKLSPGDVTLGGYFLLVSVLFLLLGVILFEALGGAS